MDAHIVASDCGWGTEGIVNTLGMKQDGAIRANDTFKRNFCNESVFVLIKISVKVVWLGPIEHNPTLMKLISCCRSGGKPIFKAMSAKLVDALLRPSATLI